jgi:hypothetical protein
VAENSLGIEISNVSTLHVRGEISWIRHFYFAKDFYLFFIFFLQIRLS